MWETRIRIGHKRPESENACGVHGHGAREKTVETIGAFAKGTHPTKIRMRTST